MTDTRSSIVEKADRLFYEKGFEHTSFSDIAGAVGISRGNFYYHFRTKDELLEAVIERRLQTTRDMLAQWDAESGAPEDRILSFIGILIANRSKIMLHGCPVGTLCGELAKLAHPAREDANMLFALFRDWLSRQFTEMGMAENADAFAMHLIARSQGVAALANAFRDENFIRSEVNEMRGWLAACMNSARHES